MLPNKGYKRLGGDRRRAVRVKKPALADSRNYPAQRRLEVAFFLKHRGRDRDREIWI